MSLLEALLLDPLRMNVWIAVRTDSVAGTGTQNDPFDGSTQAKFDAIMNALPVAALGITSSGTTATATAINHGFANGNSVLMAGATGTNASNYNGTFTISSITPNTFQYTMNGSFTGSATGTISCRLSRSGGPMVPLPLNPPIAVHLGPGLFQTNGYTDGIAGGGGWQPRPAMKIVGSGMDVTILQLAGGSTNANFYAVGHAVSPGTQPNLLDYFDISDLTIDCNLAAFTGTSPASGAVRVMGNHAKVRRLKVINWGTKSSTSAPGFVVCVVTATTFASVEDCGIEECIAVNPASPSNAVPVTVFNAGGVEVPYGGPNLTVPLAYGIAPYIRNCFVDAGEASPFSPVVQGLSMAWCKAGIIEGNQVHNLGFGIVQQQTAAQDIVIRNNWFKNVNKGIWLGSIGPPSSGGTNNLTRAGSVATVTISGGHGLFIGDSALLTTSGAYNKLVVTVLSAGYSSTTFEFNTSNSATSDSVSAVQRVFGISNTTIEGNVVELATATSLVLIAIHADDAQGTSAPSVDETYSNYFMLTLLLVRLSVSMNFQQM